MYGIATRLFIHRSSSCYINNNSCVKVIRCLSGHNLKVASNYRLQINSNFSSSGGICRAFAKYNALENAIHSEEHIDRTFIALTTAYNEQGRIYSSSILNILKNSNLRIKDDQDLLLLQCCRHATADLSLQARAELCEKVWKKLEEWGVIFNINHYNVYLQICIENRVPLDFEIFLTRMKCEPNEETHRLLLDCACEVGDVEQALKIVAMMKNKKFPADERLFNALVFGHAIKGGLSDVEKVLETMQTAHVPVSSATRFAIIRGLAWRNDRKELMRALRSFPDVVLEEELLKLLVALGLNGSHNWLDEILQILKPIRFSKQNIKELDLLCINLIHSGQPEAAITFYKKLGEAAATQDEGTYAFFLLVEMLHSATPAEIIINTTKYLQESGLNPFALGKLTGVALKKGHSEIAWKFLETMSNLRCHYFWPLLLQTAQKQGEAGVLSTLKKMLEWKVKPDLDTLEYYGIPLCDSTDPQQLLIRLQNLGFTVRDLLTPLLVFFLKENRILPVQQLCKTYEPVVIESERLLHPLVRAWKKTGDTENTLNILMKMCRTSVVPGDYVGQFLSHALNMFQLSVDHEQFLELLQKMCMKELQISVTTADSIIYRLKSPSHQCAANAKIKEAVDMLVNVSINQNHSYIPHPRVMSVTELENHLIELQNKNMETRGVLRRLIQEYTRLGKEHKANELRQQFVGAGYNETAGMKASLLQTYISNNNTDNALNMYFEIKTTHPTFVLDDFKVLDLATLLVTDNRFDSAINILLSETENSKARGGPTVVRNCWRLIGASNDETQVEKLFNLLVEKGYCFPSNIVLGPLVKVYLKKNDLNKAVQVYTDCAEKYKCTPLQLELLCAVVEGEKEDLLQEVLKVTSKIHGSEITTVSLIAALAQSGLYKSLRKFLIEVKVIPKKELERRCQRWVNENQLCALETLAKAAYKLPSNILSRSVLYHSIMKIHSINNDCESAVAFYRQLLEQEEVVPQNTVNELLRLTNRCKYEMPEFPETREAG